MITEQDLKLEYHRETGQEADNSYDTYYPFKQWVIDKLLELRNDSEAVNQLFIEKTHFTLEEND